MINKPLKHLTRKQLEAKYDLLCKAHILATRHNVELSDIIIQKDTTIEQQREAITEFIARDIFSEM